MNILNRRQSITFSMFMLNMYLLRMSCIIFSVKCESETEMYWYSRVNL
ncbi:unnamed protein product [Larinioides sclopetarius]|uniref:Uncharacterized protein n=1 Tax=Larinioides sclopetarius TaxID=280406 RepID=A0AAV1ZDM0_9ARAC